ncbi:MAG: TetR family transcriptional regulator [Verrucomicrobiales bacterium]|nr:TetR family transcriptional regulator [Verrucomicrobiales bacterium]
MEAALQLIWTNSYGSTTVDAICEKAGVKKGSFYYFFESKCELAVVAIQEDWVEKKKVLDTLFSPTQEPLDRLSAFFAKVYENQVEVHAKTGQVLGCPLATLGSEICTQEKSIQAKVSELMEQYMRYFESAIRDAITNGSIEACNVKSKAEFLFSYMHGALGQARIKNDLEGLRNLTEGAMEILKAREVQKI